MAKRTQAEQDILRRIADFSDDGERVEVLTQAARFKRSWVELGEVLTAVRRDLSFERWGFDSFVDYCRKELHLRKATAEKLTASFGYLSQYAPEVLKRDGVTEIIPQPETVQALARAREARKVPPRMFDSIQADALALDMSPSSLAKRFKEALAEPEDPQGVQHRNVGRAVVLARKLADLLADMQPRLPDALAADVEEQLGRLINFLDEQRTDRRR